MLQEELIQLGFSEKEAFVYLTLAETGRTVATTLSKRTNIPRATLYSILELLIEKGVVLREQTQASSFFMANDPDSLLRFIEKQQDQLNRKKNIVTHLVDSLRSHIKSTSYSIPRVQVFEGKQSIENMLYKYLPLWRESCKQMGGLPLFGYQDPTFVDSYLEWHNYAWSTGGKEEKICLFSNKADLKKEKGRKIINREIKALPAGIEFSSSIWLYGEYIVMGVTKQKPHFVVQMKDAIMSSNLREIFKLLWKLEPNKTSKIK